jgi:hypothetical protein
MYIVHIFLYWLSLWLSLILSWNLASTCCTFQGSFHTCTVFCPTCKYTTRTRENRNWSWSSLITLLHFGAHVGTLQPWPTMNITQPVPGRISEQWPRGIRSAIKDSCDLKTADYTRWPSYVCHASVCLIIFLARQIEYAYGKVWVTFVHCIFLCTHFYIIYIVEVFFSKKTP